MPVAKVCTGCWDRKWCPDDFSPDERQADGLQAQCKECCAGAQARYRAEHPDAVRAAQARSYRKRKEAAKR
jgi:hypothetical protein